MHRDYDMGIYTINTASRLTGVPATTLRYWEKRFGMITPMRTSSGRRLYSAHDIDHIRRIKDMIDNEHVRPREAHMLLARQLIKREPEVRTGRRTAMMIVAEMDALATGVEDFLLDEAGYDVMLVFDGQKAIAEAEEKQPDLIVLDVILPGMSGLSVCEALKGTEKTAHIPVLVLSILDVREKALAAGADGFLLKPASEPEMLRVIKEMTNESAA